MERFAERIAVVCIVLLFSLSVPALAGAHCDTLDGPVVKDARVALAGGDITPALKWVKKDHEAEIRTLFQQAVALRGTSKEAGELADRYFYETLVRVHRAGEGAPYTGLKPGAVVEPSVAEADKALESHSVEHLIKMVNDAVTAGIRERFIRVREAKRHAGESVEDGRKFVEAYVEFTHHVERLHRDAAAGGVRQGGEEEGNRQHQH